MTITLKIDNKIQFKVSKINSKNFKQVDLEDYERCSSKTGTEKAQSITNELE